MQRGRKFCCAKCIMHAYRILACNFRRKRNLRLWFTLYWIAFAPGGGGGGTPHMKGLGMLVVSLRGVNFRFWSHLRCSGQDAIIFSREGLV